jgi:FAD synthetase
MKKVMVFGAFDILHKGHKYFLKKAKEKGDYLIVILGRDLTIKKIKGSFPHENEETRLKNLLEEGIADKIKKGYLEDHLKHIKEESPGIICLGYDQEAFIEELKKYIKENSLDIEIVRLSPHNPEKYKSSILKKRMQDEKNSYNPDNSESHTYK